MKKLCTALIAAVSLCNLWCGSTLAAKGDNNQWICTRVGDTNTDKTKFYAERSDKHYFSGEASLRVLYPGTPVEGNYLEIKEMLDEALTKDTTYTISFYTKGASAKVSAATTVTVGNEFSMTLDNSAWTTETKRVGADGAKNWTKFEYSFTAADAADFVSLNFAGNTSQVVFDDMELKSAASENYLNDGSFEDYVGEKIDYDKEADDVIYTADETPSAVIGTNVAGGVVLSWRNPMVYTGISIYDWYDETRKLVSNQFTVNPGQVERYRFTAAAEEFHQYQIVFHYADKPSQSFYVSERASGSWGWQMDRFTCFYYRGGDANQTCPAKSELDSEVKHGDEGYSFRFQSNFNKAYDDMSHDAFAWLATTLPLEQGQTYQISFWMKTEELAEDLKVNVSYNNFTDSTQKVTGSAGTHDWTQIVKYYECANGGNNFMINIDCAAKNVWIDDIDVRIVDADNQPYGDNLLPEGDFETYGQTTVGAISKLTAEGMDRAVQFNWKLPAADYNGCKVYQKRGDDFAYIGYTTPNDGSLYVDGLDYAKTYTYRFVPYNAYGVPGTPMEVSARTAAPDKLISVPVLTKDGVEIGNANASGSYVVRTEVKNNQYDAGLNFDQIVAIYSGDELVGIHSTAKKIKRGSYASDPVQLNTPFKIDTNGTYTVKVFLIDNRTDMNLYQRSVEFK